MSAQPSPTPPPDDLGQHAADPHGYGEVLHDLITMGAGFARLLHGQATTQAHAAQHPAAPAPHDTTAQPAPDALIPLSTAFDRVARAVRRSILLARSLAQPVRPAPIQPAQDPARTRAAARRRILREVEDAIQRPSGPADHPGADALRAELHDRLDTPDLDADLTTRPVAEIITELCRDLGLAALPGARPWQRRTPADIAQLRTRAAASTTSRHPGAEPQGSRRDATPPPSNPSPDQRPPTSITPGVPHEQPGPHHSGSNPPWNPAETTTTMTKVPRHPARDPKRWHPPPRDSGTPQAPLTQFPC